MNVNVYAAGAVATVVVDSGANGFTDCDLVSVTATFAASPLNFPLMAVSWGFLTPQGKRRPRNLRPPPSLGRNSLQPLNSLRPTRSLAVHVRPSPGHMTTQSSIQTEHFRRRGPRRRPRASQSSFFLLLLMASVQCWDGFTQQSSGDPSVADT